MARKGRLIVIRHAEAHPSGPAGGDAHRELTENGALASQRLAVVLHRLGITEPVVLSSPLVRARQTADLLAAGTLGKVEIRQALAGPSADEILSDARAAVRDHPGATILLVGHEPTVSSVVGALLGDPDAAVSMRTACAACFRVADGGDASLRWFLDQDATALLAH